MRSLSFKLTLAFLLVGLTGAILVAVLVGGLTRREFDQFVVNRFQLETVASLAEYYETNGSWDGLDSYLQRIRGRGQGRYDPNRSQLVLFDANGNVLIDSRPPNLQRVNARLDVSQAIPVEIEGQVAGYVQFNSPHRILAIPQSPEVQFLERVNQAALLSALAAGLLALLLGLALARTISRPLRELTAGTRAVSAGDLGHQVPVRTKDEVGELARSFNRMSADLALSNQLRRQMTADIAHDLRTPLSVILGYTEALHDGKLPGNAETYGAMHLQAQHLNRLIDDLRTLSLADAGQLTLRRQPVHPLVLLEHTALAYMPQAESRDVRLEVRGENGPAIGVDQDRLLQVLGNLVSNALRHSPDGSTVYLEAKSTGDEVLLIVQDAGSGIALEDLPHVFDRFYRGDKSRAVDGSSGLGLAIARSLVEAHGGYIAVASEPGHGSQFTIHLPVTATAWIPPGPKH
ncbi:MAG: HAMP domain-containing sensor histidine kinase [Chloroflexota bacterium]|jgi:two-component system, OmpR family, sensor histidine kinase BaeS